MKKILLIGDSIRLGYCGFVKKAFEDTAEVYYPEENCRFAEYVLRGLHEWKNELSCGDDIDLVHWNVGLWDNLILFEEEKLTPLAVYESYIDRICHRIKLLFPKAKMVFATSTAVLEDLYADNMKRYNADTVRYNEAAASIVVRNGGIINDLYAITKDFPRAYYSDQTHLNTRDGARAITNQVVKCIGTCLDIEAKTLDYEKLFESDQQVAGL